MKNYIMPQIEISKFNKENIVMSSATNNWVPAIAAETNKAWLDYDRLEKVNAILTF